MADCSPHLSLATGSTCRSANLIAEPLSVPDNQLHLIEMVSPSSFESLLNELFENVIADLSILCLVSSTIYQKVVPELHWPYIYYRLKLYTPKHVLGGNWSRKYVISTIA
jgi:hypothetical protein